MIGSWVDEAADFPPARDPRWETVEGGIIRDDEGFPMIVVQVTTGEGQAARRHQARYAYDPVAKAAFTFGDEAWYDVILGRMVAELDRSLG